MLCVNCKAKLFSPVKKCAAGAEPYMLKCGHMGCAFNTAQINKGIRDHAEHFPARTTKGAVNASQLSDEELKDLFTEIYQWRETGKLTGDKLSNLATQWFGANSGMLTATEEYILFEMARRKANATP